MCATTQSAATKIHGDAGHQARERPWLFTETLRILSIGALRSGSEYKGGAHFLKSFRIEI